MKNLLRPAALLFAAALLGGPAAQAVEMSPANPAPAELYGTYGPRGNCEASPRVSLDATGLYFISGNTRGRAPQVDMCFSCAGGARYSGKQVWMYIGVGKDNAAIVIFNAGEKTGALEVEATGDVPIGPNLKALVAASPYRRCGPPTQAAR